MSDHDNPKQPDDEVENEVITETVMEEGITNPPPSSAINETLLEDQIGNSSSSVNATEAVILPAYIAYANFVLFRFY